MTPSELVRVARGKGPDLSHADRLGLLLRLADALERADSNCAEWAKQHAELAARISHWLEAKPVAYLWRDPSDHLYGMKCKTPDQLARLDAATANGEMPPLYLARVAQDDPVTLRDTFIDSGTGPSCPFCARYMTSGHAESCVFTRLSPPHPL